MKKTIDKIKENKGSITLYVLVAILFFIIIIFASYSSTVNKKVAQDKEFNKIKEAYEKEYPIQSSQLFIHTDITKTNPEAAMPANSTVLERDANKGIVIQDSNKNEWVWVEVPKTEVFTTTTNKTDYSNIEDNLKTYAGVYRKGSSTQNCDWKDEWYAMDGTTLVTASTTDLTETQKALNNGCGLTYNEYDMLYKKMLSSIYIYGGFWISRYEIGDRVATTINDTRNSESGITGTPVSKANQISYNFVTCSQAQSLANGMSTDTTKSSSLLFGIQWDLVCKFLEVNSEWDTTNNEASYYINTDSSSWGNYKNSSLTLNRGKYNVNPEDSTSVWNKFTIDTENYVTNSQTSNDENYYQLLTTGASDDTNVMNIYDFAGNEWEWTLEHATTVSDRPCADRGGGYNNISSDYPAAYRWNVFTSGINDNISFRASLY